MKKLIAIALAAMLAPAWGAEVVSSNIVGYEKITLSTGYNMIGVQFVQVGGESLDLGTVGILDDSMEGFDEDGNFATEMRIWNGNGYTSYGWSGSSGTDVLEDPDFDNQWLDKNSMELVDENSAAGSGFWINAATAGTMTISGEVPSSESVTVNLAAGYNIVANPYPGNVLISNFGTLDSSFAGFDEDGNFATEMRVWNGNGYTSYGWSGSSGTDVLEDPDFDNQWLDKNSMELVEDTIPYGHAVWINASSSGTITFTSPTAE